MLFKYRLREREREIGGKAKDNLSLSIRKEKKKWDCSMAERHFTHLWTNRHNDNVERDGGKYIMELGERANDDCRNVKNKREKKNEEAR